MNSIFKTAIVAVSTLTFTPALTAGTSTTIETSPASCTSCTPGNCTCEKGCGCAVDGHDYFPHAPIGVMGDHIHRKGGLMASYRYMFMRMGQNYDGDSKISDEAARQGYMMAPTDMDMQMHMLGLMYAPANNLTLMLMTNYQENSMDMINMMGTKSSMESSGWGDTTLSAYYGLYKNSNSSAHVGLGLSMPTGSTDEELRSGVHHPYPMQLGSGTWDLKPSVTWLGHCNQWSYGSQLSGVIHLGDNDEGYALGDSAEITGWVSRRLSAWSAVSLRLTGSTWGNVNGQDDKMPTIPMGPMAGQPMASPADPDARGGSSIDVALGLNLWHTDSGLRFAVEVGAPAYQNLDGPQLGTDWFLTTGLQFAW